MKLISWFLNTVNPVPQTALPYVVPASTHHAILCLVSYTVHIALHDLVALHRARMTRCLDLAAQLLPLVMVPRPNLSWADFRL